MSFRPAARSKDLIIRRFEDETVIYDISTQNALYLNETSAHIWELCDGKRSVEEIRRELWTHYDTAVSTEYVSLTLYQLQKDKLLKDSVEMERFVKKYSGRTAIRLLKVRTLMALPRITSVIAPTALAASCLAVPPVIGAQKPA
ncbi:MAG: PqqD family protein [Pyrinomonadaceae bacterium]